MRKTGRLVVAHEASKFLGLGAEIAAQVMQRCFYHLEAPVERVTGYDIPYPPSRFEEEFLPHTVLPSGRTVAQEIMPAVESAYATGAVTPLQIEGGHR